MAVAHRRAEEGPGRRRPRSRRFRVHHGRGCDARAEKADPPVDLAQPALAVRIVGVVTAIAVARRPRHPLRHGRTLPGEQKAVLLCEALQAAGRDVVLAGWCGRVLGRFSGETLSQLVSPSGAHPRGATTLAGRWKGMPVPTGSPLDSVLPSREHDPPREGRNALQSWPTTRDGNENTGCPFSWGSSSSLTEGVTPSPLCMDSLASSEKGGRRQGDRRLLAHSRLGPSFREGDFAVVIWPHALYRLPHCLS